MMHWVDTHVHLYAEQYDEDREAVVQRALDAGVRQMYMPNIDAGSIEAMLEVEARWPEHCFPMMGLHPCSVDGDFRQALDTVYDWLSRRPFAGVGEIGLDLHWDDTWFVQQQEAFRQQVQWAMELGLPVVIHTRKTIPQVLDILEAMADERLHGIMHCFTGTVEEAQRAIELGLKLGIGGVLTFKNSGLDKVVAQLPIDHLVLETDGPWLTPTPWRGKRNESSYIPLIGRKLAEVTGMDVEEVARITTRNAGEVFGGVGARVNESENEA